MNHRAIPVALTLLACALALPASASAQSLCRPLCSPTVLLQPGFISADIAGDASPETDLNLRIVTAIPTFLARTRINLAVQWSPLRKIDDRTVNEPSFHYGPAFTVVNQRWIAAEVELLGAYGPALRAEDAPEQRYSHELLLQGDLLLKAGWLWADPESRWRDLGIYAMVGYLATGVDEGTSPWMVMTGVSVPITP